MLLFHPDLQVKELHRSGCEVEVTFELDVGVEVVHKVDEDEKISW